MFKLMRSGCCFVFLFIPFPLLPLTHPLSFPFSLKPTLGAETYMPNNYETQFGVLLAAWVAVYKKTYHTVEFPAATVVL